MSYGDYKDVMDETREGAMRNTEHKLIVSRTNEFDGVVGYGKPVARGATDKSARPTQAGDTVIQGITVRERSGTVDGWKQYQEMRVMKKGVVAVLVTSAVEEEEAVHVDLAAGTFSNSGGLVVENAAYETSAAAGELAFVRMH